MRSPAHAPGSRARTLGGFDRAASSPRFDRLALVAALALLGACVPPPDRGGGQATTETDAKPPGEAGPKRTATIDADGWNDNIAWRGLDEGLAEAKSSGMPLMLVVHTSWCGNCRKLKRTFMEVAELETLSEQFVMVHVDQDEHPEATLYGPDGQYIPRVMFLDADGNVDQGLQNPNRQSRYRYFYTPEEDLVATMRRALTQHGNAS